MQRTKDIVSGAEDLEPLFTIDNFPVFQGCTNASSDLDIKCPLDFYISKGTGMVQLKSLLPLELIYQSEHNPGTTGATWLQHHNEFAEFLTKYHPQNVFEIGGSHGILSENCYQLNNRIKWTILEPAPVAVEGLHAELIQGFFTKDTRIDSAVDMIVHSHVLEHIYDPSEFFASLAKLPMGTRMCFSVPALESHIKQKFTNALSFEHSYFCTEEFVEYWLSVAGFRILDKQTHRDHSIFYATERDTVAVLPVPDSYNKNKQLFDQYIQYHKQNIDTLNAHIQSATVPVFLFGAHVFSQALIAMGLDTNLAAVLDNSTLKQNRRLYGTELTVSSPSVLREQDAVVILQAGAYTEEIRNDILTNINSRTTFI